MLRIILALLLAPAAYGLVPFFTDATYERDEPTNPPWFVENNGLPSRLYHNGVFQSQESGTDDLNLFAAWAIQPTGAKVGVIDMGPHGDRVFDLVLTTSPNSVRQFITIVRWTPEEIASGIMEAIGGGCRIATITGGFSAPNATLEAACRAAEACGLLLCCSTPNTEGNLDAGMVDYPYEWSRQLANIIGVSSTDRSGLHYSPSATGSNCIAAPGRNIVAAGTYSSGTSYATPIAAGCLALVVQRYPGQSNAAYRSLLRQTSRGPAGEIDPVAALTAPTPTLTISREWITVQGLPGWQYQIERTEDFQNWAPVAVVYGGGGSPAEPGFFRARVK